MRIQRIAAITAIITLTLSGCVTQDTTPTPPPDTPATPLVESSTPSTSPSPSPAPVTRPTIPEDFVSRIDGSTATIPLATAALQLLRGTDAGLLFNTTPDAYDNLITATKDLILVTAPSQEELDEAAAAGVELDVIPIVKDALVFLANTANPVDNLTQQQVTDIYTGKITNWNQVGGNDAPIIPYQRQVNSGSQTLFLQLAMGDTTPMDAPVEWRPDSMGELIDTISSYDNSDMAIGFSVYYYTQQMYIKDNVKLLSIDGVSPTNESISLSTYPYGTYYYAIVRQDEPADSTARQLIDWLQTWEGQQLSSSVGYVPQSQSDIVPLRESYGYFGSTQVNTTQSSGTGGPIGYQASSVPSCIDDESCFTYDNQGHISDVTIPGYPEAEAAVQAWIDERPQVNWDDEVLMSSYKGLITLTFDHDNTQDYGVFRLSDGQRPLLSDFFYDGVNYIDFINKNLLDTERSQAVSDCVALGTCPFMTVAPFTGIPSTYDLYEFDWFTNAFALYFETDNPFVVLTDPNLPGFPVKIPIHLPPDLSPYGTYWRINRVMIGQTQVDHIQRNYGSPDPVDAVINQRIDTYAAQHPSAKVVRIEGWQDGIAYVDYDTDMTQDFIKFDYVTGEQI